MAQDTPRAVERYVARTLTTRGVVVWREGRALSSSAEDLVPGLGGVCP
jgi:hypothetical protein